MKQPPVSMTGIWLVREGEHCEVRVERGGKWITVIREFVDSPFSHIVEPAGILAAEKAAGGEP